MKRLTRFFVITVIITLGGLYTFFPISVHTARADDNYLRVIEQGVYFYEIPDLSGKIFELPYGYYLKKTGASGEFIRIECYGAGSYTPLLDGYVLAEETIYEAPELSPYLDFTVTTADSAVLYSDTSLKEPLQFIFKNRTLGYYGKAYAEDGSNLYCVTYNSRMGFIKEEYLYPFTVPEHPTPIITETIADSETSPDATEEKSDSDKVLKILVVVALVAAAIIILGLIVLPEKKERALTSNDDY